MLSCTSGGRSEATLLPIIKDSIEPGTLITSDCYQPTSRVSEIHPINFVKLICTSSKQQLNYHAIIWLLQSFICSLSGSLLNGTALSSF